MKASRSWHSIKSKTLNAGDESRFVKACLSARYTTKSGKFVPVPHNMSLYPLKMVGILLPFDFDTIKQGKVIPITTDSRGRRYVKRADLVRYFNELK